MTIPMTRRRENTRARLLDAAAQVFAEAGLEGASVEAICERAGFTRGAFYSNFESKDELFLELSSTVAVERLTSVRARIDEFVASGVLKGDADPIDLVKKIMDSGVDDRRSVMMMTEIHIRALRDRDFGAAYLAQDQAMIASIEGIIQSLVDSGLFVLRLEVPEAARILMLLWEAAMVRGAIEGQQGEPLHSAGSEMLGHLVALMIVPSAECC